MAGGSSTVPMGPEGADLGRSLSAAAAAHLAPAGSGDVWRGAPDPVSINSGPGSYVERHVCSPPPPASASLLRRGGVWRRRWGKKGWWVHGRHLLLRLPKLVAGW